MNDFPIWRRILYGVALAVFGALGGTGATWIVVARLANSTSKSHGYDFLADSPPKLVSGGAVGFLIGLIAAVLLLRASASTLVALEERFIGRRGARSLYAGVPVFFLALLVPAVEPLARRFGNTAAPCMVLASFLFVIGVSLFLYDRIPPRLIIPLGLLSWLLTFSLACCYSWFGSGAFR